MGGHGRGLAFLARRGFAATALLFAPEVHGEGRAAAQAAGARLEPAGSEATLLAHAAASDVWLDGLAGIGARGGLRDPAAGAVRALTALRESTARPPLVVAVDTPSGIGVDDGTLPGAVLPADVTITMGALKAGLLLPPAAALAGDVRLVDLGLGAGLKAAVPVALRLRGADVAALWPVPSAATHKYDRGVLGLVSGSPRYPGAGVLAAAGALGTGLGMVRYLGDEAVLRLVRASHPEVVGAAGRVQAWALGSGIDPADDAVLHGLREVVRGALEDRLPVVLDAGALALLEPRPGGRELPLPPSVVLTPHAGELAALLSARGVRVAGAPVSRRDVEAAPLRWARTAAVQTGASVLLKGAVTVVAGPDGPAYAQADATPWLATAGAGDVLAGVLGALLAGRCAAVQGDPSLAARLAAAAALVHGRAGVAASAAGPVAASDVARALPGVVRGILAAR